MTGSLDKLISGERPALYLGGDRLPDQAILMSGSFNPLHQGHIGLLRAAEEISSRKGLLELSVTNVDKPPLNREEVERRLQSLEGNYPVVLTRAPTFLEKAELFPGVWFALGFDTAVRLLSTRYHPDVKAMLKRFEELNTQFVVAGRLFDGVYQGLSQLEMPDAFSRLFLPVPEELFREDISSSEIRGDNSAV